LPVGGSTDEEAFNTTPQGIAVLCHASTSG
jgi:hypothetical protein